MRIIRKGLGIFLVDIIIIIGIFILQFRTDSYIMKKLGNLQITLEQSVSEDNITSLLNKLQVTYNGLSLYCDDENPAKIRLNDGSEKEIKFIDYEQKDDLACELIFEDDVVLNVKLSDNSEDAELQISTSYPTSISAVYIPYKYSRNLILQESEINKLVLNNKQKTWNLTATNIENNILTLQTATTVAKYKIHDEKQKFTFENIVDFAAAQEGAYLNTVNALKDNLISLFNEGVASSSTLSEQAVVSYVAAMAERGLYRKAIDSVPQSFKRVTQRTYLSAPYFNSLSAMNTSLDKYISEIQDKISESVNSSSLEIFTTDNLAFNFVIYPNSETVLKVLSKVIDLDVESLSIDVATGILKTYQDLLSLDKDYANVLSQILEPCLEKITMACNIDGESLTISENDTFLSVAQAVNTGITLMKYGLLVNNLTYVKAGRLLVNSYIADSSSFDLNTLSQLYPIIAYDNVVYPHFSIIGSLKDKKVWTWSSSEDIKFNFVDNVATIELDFIQNQTQHVIFKEIPPFTSIYIYDVIFRTDPRFETYNSSGYVYKNEKGTLLLKSRHKAEKEIVRLDYKPVVKKEVVPIVQPTVKENKNVEVKTENTEIIEQVTESESSTEIQPEETTVTEIVEPEVIKEAPVVEIPKEVKYAVYLDSVSSKRKMVGALKGIFPQMKATDADTFIKDLPKLIRNDLTQEQANEMVKTLTEASGTARIEQMQ
jgi:hypothetical protein